MNYSVFLNFLSHPEEGKSYNILNILSLHCINSVSYNTLQFVI